MPPDLLGAIAWELDHRGTELRLRREDERIAHRSGEQRKVLGGVNTTPMLFLETVPSRTNFNYKSGTSYQMEVNPEHDVKSFDFDDSMAIQDEFQDLQPASKDGYLSMDRVHLNNHMTSEYGEPFAYQDGATPSSYSLDTRKRMRSAYRFGNIGDAMELEDRQFEKRAKTENIFCLTR